MKECERCGKLDRLLQDSMKALASLVNELIDQREEAREEAKKASKAQKQTHGISGPRWSCVVLDSPGECAECHVHLPNCRTAYVRVGIGAIPCALCVGCYDRLPDKEARLA